MSELNRRDFLKLMAAISGSLMMPSSGLNFNRGFTSQGRKPNVLLLLFDAMSARHLSIYGYARKTTPHLERLAETSVVFHSHTSAGNFTTPGTASMLMGMYPWQHRAINAGGLIRRDLLGSNIFRLLGNEYYRVAYSQNYLVDVFLRQFQGDIDWHVPPARFNYRSLQLLPSWYLGRDSVISYYALDNFAFDGTNIPAAAFLGYVDVLFRRLGAKNDSVAADYPYGLPDNHYAQYLNSVVYDGIAGIIQQVVAHNLPFFAYFHLFSPHAPYAPRREFMDSLGELETVYKPRHSLASNHLPKKELDRIRKQYDEYIADVDAEIGRLVDALENAGLLRDTVLILTADHGELFERGEYGHQTRLLFDPVIHIPLLIKLPGQQSRFDVYSPTSNIDLLPTLLHLAGQPIPSGVEGEILPLLGGSENPKRSVFSMDAKENSAFAPLRIATLSLTRGKHKLIYYMGYPKHADKFELYHLGDDLEEKKDLIHKDAATAASMKEELLERLGWINRSFIKPK